jgi:hypothetical protein
LQALSVVIWINITALQVSYVREGFEGHKAGARDGRLLEISQPPVSVRKMALLQYGPFRNELVESVDRVGERDAINFVDLIGHQQNALRSRSALENE